MKNRLVHVAGWSGRGVVRGRCGIDALRAGFSESERPAISVPGCRLHDVERGLTGTRYSSSIDWPMVDSYGPVPCRPVARGPARAWEIKADSC